jgi:hypothetical protein
VRGAVGHSGPALESAEHRHDCLEHNALGDLYQPLLLDLHNLPVKIPFNGVNLLHVPAWFWVKK